MHSVQADDTLGGPHVQAHGKSMRDVVMHSLLHSPTKFCIAKQKDDRSATEKHKNALLNFCRRNQRPPHLTRMKDSKKSNVYLTSPSATVSENEMP